ncbi:MAG: DPP IV N-terminal domain-containing protein [Acidobacteria bacterium]|nr:DPP IV N-terminal domain-containing protein [Acidobacteriota bacterium]
MPVRRGQGRLVLLAVLALLVGLPPAAGQVAPSAKKPLRLEEIFSEHGLTGPLPTQMRWSPDGRLLSYILESEKDGRRDLWAVEAETGEKHVLVSDEQMKRLAPPPEEAAADERERERLLRYAVAAYVWSPDSKQILFTSAGRLYLYDLASQEAKPLAASKRDVRDPKFSPDGKWVSFVWEHDLWLVAVPPQCEEQQKASGASLDSSRLSSGHARDLRSAVATQRKAQILLASLSAGLKPGPDQTVQGGSACKDAGSSEAKRLTLGGSADVLHGDLDWVYPEELGIRSGYEWSPDSRRIVFLELAEHSVPTYPLVDLVEAEAQVDFQRYPKAGDPNPKAHVGVVEISAAERGGAEVSEVIWLDRAAEYIPRFGWVDAGRLWVQLLDRGQRELELVVFELESGRSRTLLVERDPHWINITDDLRFFRDREEFLWTSERTGYRHIYVYGFDGQLKRRLTDGEREVHAIEGVDERGGWVYFSSNFRHGLGRDFYRAWLDGRGTEVLTELPGGTHSVVMNPAATAYAGTFSALGRPPEITVHHLPSGRRTEAHRAKGVDGYEMVTPELVELRAADGALVRGMLLRPKELERFAKLRQAEQKQIPRRQGVQGLGMTEKAEKGSRSAKGRKAAEKKYPVVMYVYGGPRAPTIRDAWGGNRYLFHQYLVQQGYVVLYVDDRASSVLGHKHEAALHRAYGPTALADHRVAVEWLKAQPWADAERIAIWGWSGGGFSTCFALTHSDLFKVGIAVAPVTDWRLYDSIYTERYMGLPSSAKATEGGPQEDPYDGTSCVKVAANLKGRLLLVHGTMDDNVHPQNAEQFIHALIEAGQPFDLLLYPRKTHSIRGSKTQLHLFRYVEEYLKKHL